MNCSLVNKDSARRTWSLQLCFQHVHPWRFIFCLPIRPLSTSCWCRPFFVAVSCWRSVACLWQKGAGAAACVCFRRSPVTVDGRGMVDLHGVACPVRLPLLPARHKNARLKQDLIFIQFHATKMTTLKSFLSYSCSMLLLTPVWESVHFMSSFYIHFGVLPSGKPAAAQQLPSLNNPTVLQFLQFARTILWNMWSVP